MVAEATPMEEKRQRREEAGKEEEVGEEKVNEEALVRFEDRRMWLRLRKIEAARELHIRRKP